MTENVLEYETADESSNLDELRSVAKEQGYEFGILETYDNTSVYKMDRSEEDDFFTVLYGSEEDAYSTVDRGLFDEERRALQAEEMGLEDFSFR